MGVERGGYCLVLGTRGGGRWIGTRASTCSSSRSVDLASSRVPCDLFEACFLTSAPHWSGEQADRRVCTLTLTTRSSRKLQMTDFSSLRLLNVAMHQVKEAEGPGAKFITVLTEELVELSHEDRQFLAKRFRTALAKNARPIRELTPPVSDVPSELRAIWVDPGELLNRSAVLAERLAVVQTYSSLPGLLVVAECLVGNEVGLLVAKVEHQEAMRIEPTTNRSGHQVFTIERLRELVFGEGARVYKIAFFSKSLSAQGSLAGDVADVQNGVEIATYFLTTFLGCTLREDPPVLTEKALVGLTRAINESGMNAEKVADTQSALVSEFKSNDRTFLLRNFIQRHVPDGFQAQVAHAAESAGVPVAEFNKDISLVKSKLSITRIQLADDVFVSAPADEIGEGKAVEVSSTDDPVNPDRVTVQGVINSVKSRGLR